MVKKIIALIDKLQATGSLTVEEYKFLIDNRTPEAAELMELRFRLEMAEKKIEELSALFDTNALNFLIS